MWYYRLIVFLTALDLTGKSAIEALPTASFPRELPAGKPVLLLKKFQNRGLPLGFLERRRGLVKAGPLLVESLVLLRFSRLLPKRRCRLEKTALALILAGGGSNLFDRFFRGYVVDYFSPTQEKMRYLVFNLGDLYIAVGMTLLSVLEFMRGLKRIGTKGVKH